VIRPVEVGDDREVRILRALVAAKVALRNGKGNPYHDAEGHFTNPAGVGHAGHEQEHDKHSKATDFADENHSNDKVRYFLWEISKLWRPSLSGDQKRAIKSYSKNAYVPINNFLRQGTIAASKKDLAQSQIDRMDQAMGQSRIEKPIVGYRGISDLHAIGIDRDNAEGATVKDNGFLSMSMRPKIAEGFTGSERNKGNSALLRIKVPAGSRGMSMHGLSDADEFEVLMDRGSSMRITRAVTRDDGRLVLDAELYQEERKRDVERRLGTPAADDDGDELGSGYEQKYGWASGDVEVTWDDEEDDWDDEDGQERSFRSAKGNPHHDAEGHFTQPGSEGHAAAKPAKPAKPGKVGSRLKQDLASLARRQGHALAALADRHGLGGVFSQDSLKSLVDREHIAKYVDYMVDARNTFPVTDSVFMAACKASYVVAPILNLAPMLPAAVRGSAKFKLDLLRSTARLMMREMAGLGGGPGEGELGRSALGFLTRGGEGNPYHDKGGHFTHKGGEGHASAKSGSGIHHRQHKERIEQSKRHKRELAEMESKHQKQREDLAKKVKGEQDSWNKGSYQGDQLDQAREKMAADWHQQQQDSHEDEIAKLKEKHAKEHRELLDSHRQEWESSDHDSDKGHSAQQQDAAPSDDDSSADVPAGKFKTLKHAESWAKKAFPNAKFEPGDLSVDSCNDICTELDRMSGNYNEVAKSIKGISGRFGNPPDINESNCSAYYDIPNQTLVFNPKFFNDKAQRAKIQASGVTGFLHSGSAASIVTHEFGHAVDFWMDRSFSPEMTIARKKLRDLFKKNAPAGMDEKAFVGLGLSQYAATNSRERFAETFSAIYHERSKTTDLHPEASKNMKKVVGAFQKIINEVFAKS
jgi:hypothetical protein